MAPTLPPPGFAREATPTWLATVALLAGHRPPEVGDVERYVLLGCGEGETAAVVAANHPGAEVWAWDEHAGAVEATRRLGTEAGLGNLVVHEGRDLPLDLGGGPADVIVVQDVPAAADDGMRSRLAAAIEATLRPGGLLSIGYPTLAGWAEVAPVQALLRQLAALHRGAPEELVPAVLGGVGRLRAAGARYLTDRPVVAEWLDRLAQADPAEVAARFLLRPFRPMSPAQVAATLAPAACVPVGAARPTDDLDLDLPPALAAELAAAASRVVRETYRDLATRRSYRRDVFRLGGAALSAGERVERLSRLGLAGLAGPEEPPAAAVDHEVWGRLTSFGATAAELHADPGEAARITAVLLDAGQAHPVVADGPRRGAVDACDALNGALAARPGGGPDLRAVALLGSAVGVDRSANVRGMPAPRKAT